MSAGRAIVPGVGVRDMGLLDVDDVLAIERAAYPSPWSRSMFLGELLCDDTIALVAVEEERVVGYLLASDQAGSWHVLNVCVHPDRRRGGVGQTLMRELFHRAGARPHRGFTLEVRVSNAAAIRLYERLGFTSHGVRPGYYSDNGEDALVMWRGGSPETA
ncbi:MAG: ribosomal protein S18-alanine N-acetyltransferase [Actinomycetota bacterium]